MFSPRLQFHWHLILTQFWLLTKSKDYESTGCGHFEISAKRFKIIIVWISVRLSNIFNMCIQMSYFPDLFKILRAVHKSKSIDPLLLKSYQPILSLSVFSKILKKYVFEHISNFLTHRNFWWAAVCFINGLSKDISVANY